MTDDNDLGVYYKCLRGINSHFGLSEPHSFAVNDAAGRDWICYPVPKDVVHDLDLLSDLVDVERADAKSADETVVRLVFCRTTDELAANLAEESPEDEEEV